MTLAVAAAISLIEQDNARDTVKHTLRRWGKFLAGLAAIAVVVQILTWVS